MVDRIIQLESSYNKIEARIRCLENSNRAEIPSVEIDLDKEYGLAVNQLTLDEVDDTMSDIDEDKAVGCETLYIIPENIQEKKIAITTANSLPH